MSSSRSPRRASVSLPLADTAIPIQARNALVSYGIRTVGQLVLLTKREIGLIDQIGQVSITQIQQALQHIGHTMLHEDADALVKGLALYDAPANVPARVIASRWTVVNWWNISRSLNDYTLGEFARLSPEPFSQQSRAYNILDMESRQHIRNVLQKARIEPGEW